MNRRMKKLQKRQNVILDYNEVEQIDVAIARQAYEKTQCNSDTISHDQD